MSLLHLLRKITLRHLYLNKGRTLLSALGIALGVGVFISVQIAIQTAIHSFNETVDHVAGKANLQVKSYGRGFSEEVYLNVKKWPVSKLPYRSSSSFRRSIADRRAFSSRIDTSVMGSLEIIGSRSER
jgi:putative ABC transport system permease protein